jgi:Membrane-bound lysozyme-inhibitor of c-type lysozyme
MPFFFRATVYLIGFAMTAGLALVAAAGPVQASAHASTVGLPPARPPVRFRCDGDPPLAFTITYYATDPGTLVAERRGRRIVMTQQPMASGVRYTAAGASFAEHQGVAWITWPGQPRPLRCVR